MSLASGSTSAYNTADSTHANSTHDSLETLQTTLANLTAELASIDADIAQLTALRARVVRERDGVRRGIDAFGTARSGSVNGNNKPNGIGNTNGKGKSKPNDPCTNTTTDYTSSSFPWSAELRARMRDVFGIEKFRLCQEG